MLSAVNNPGSNWSALARAPGWRYRVTATVMGVAGGALVVAAIPAILRLPLFPYLLFFTLAMGGTFIVIHFASGTTLAMQGSVTLAAVWLFGWEACVPINLAAATLLLRNRLHPWRWLFAWSNTIIWMSVAGLIFQAYARGTLTLQHSWGEVAVLLLAGLVCSAGLAVTPAVLLSADRRDPTLLSPRPLAEITSFIFLSFVPVSYLMALGFLMGPGAGILLAVAVWVLTSLALKGYAETGHANARLREAMRELEELSVTDSLTGLYNRRNLDSLLMKEIGRHERHGIPLSLLRIDLCGFKRVNDEHGHLEGDRVLAGVAAAIRQRLRGEDQAFRWGGDEFAVLAPHTPPAGARALADALSEQIGTSDLSVGESPLRLSVSIGIASYPQDGSSPGELVAAADRALYSARATGAAVGEASSQGEEYGIA